MTYKVVCALGDSITNGYWDEAGSGGWFGRLAPLLMAKRPYGFGFNNLAVDGDRSYDVLHRLQTEVQARNPSVLLISIGVNDLIRWDQADAPVDLSLPLREEIWGRILKTAKQMVPHVLVTSLLPVNQAKLPGCGVGGRLTFTLESDINSYNAFLAERCAAHSIPFADLAAACEQTSWTEMLFDESHPNAAGHQFLAEQMFSHLDKLGWI